MSSTLRYWHGPATTRSSLTSFWPMPAMLRSIPSCRNIFCIKQTSLLAVWGKNDPFFLPPGAEAFKRDNPNAEVHFYDTGHFALETHHREIAGAIRDFLGRKLSLKATAA
jgi:pimeloyl-ACP methyl ester carboxylesterase